MRRRDRLQLSLKRRQTRYGGRRFRRIELFVLVVGALVALGLYLDSHPIRLGADRPPQSAGTSPTAPGQGDVLLITSAERVTIMADSIDTIDFTANWANILEQEFGPFRIADARQFSPSNLGDTALVVVSRLAGREMEAGQVATLERFVQSGGTLLVEMPTAMWNALVGVTVEPAQYRPTRRITAFDGSAVRGDIRDDTIQAPLRTTLAPIQVAEAALVENLEILMEVDGLPAFTRRSLGRGTVYALYFDFSRAVAVIQQGLPDANWEIARPSLPLPSGYTRTASLIVDPRMRRSATPFADLLERQVLDVVTSQRPTPRVWNFPGTRSGALVMTHSAEPSLELGQFMLDWEREANVPITVFAAADELGQLGDGLRRLAGLLLIPPERESAPVSRIGLLGFEPLASPLSLQQQVTAARTRVGEDMLLTRMDEGLWHPHYGTSFRILAGLGVTADSSYGPAVEATDPEASDGYAFGTGLPFRPLDRHGRLFPLWEVPYVLHDGDNLDRAWTERLLDDAARSYNQLIVADWRTGTMAERPRADIVTTWRRTFELASERDMWLTDLGSFIRFWNARRTVELRSTFSRSERRLSVWAEAPDLEDRRGEPFHFAIAFESRFDDRPVERVTRNGDDVPFAELGRSGDGIFQLLELLPGTNRVEIAYQGPIELPE